MRRHLLFTTTLLLLIAAGAAFAFAFKDHAFVLPGAGAEHAHAFVQNFRATHRPITELNLTHLYGNSGKSGLLHPVLDTKAWIPLAPDISCPSTAPIGEELVSQVPLISDSGESYAKTLVDARRVGPDEKTWVRDHLSYFKVSELSGLLDHYGIQDPVFSTLAKLDDSTVKELAEGVPLAMSAEFLFVKDESQLGFTPLNYAVFDMRDVRAALASGPYELAKMTTEDSVCIEKIGDLCWTYNSRTALAALSKYNVAILIVIGFSILLLYAVHTRHLLAQERDHRRHRTAVQVLSHEFRTPVASALLLIENFERDPDAITKIGGEVHRLRRVIEMTKTYLQTTDDKPRFNIGKIPSLNTWMADFVEEVDSRIQLHPLARDRAIEADQFWLRFVLSNLIQNAFAHGAEPVRVRLSESGQRVRVVVEDQGECEFNSIHTMTEAFVKSPKSQGMGLGLGIVDTIVRDWGGKLEFSRAPTSFAVALDISTAEEST